MIFALVARELGIQLESKCLKIVQNLVNFINAFPLGLHFLSRVYFPRLCLLITFFNFVPSLEQLQILHGMNENVCVEGILSD